VEKKKIKVGIIGLGHQNMTEQIPAVLRNGNIDIVQVCDMSQAAIDNFYKTYPQFEGVTKKYTDYKEMVADKPFFDELDFVIVALPHSKYYDVCEILCAKKKYFMKEKPLSKDLHEAIMLEKIPGFDKYCFICAQRGYSQLFLLIEKFIRDNMEEILSIHCLWRLPAKKVTVGWRADGAESGGGVIVDMGYHIIGLLTNTIGLPSDITARYAQAHNVDYNTEDVATILFSQKDLSLQGSLILSRVHYEKQQSILVVTERYVLEYKDDNHLILQDKKNNILLDARQDNKSIWLDNQLHFFLRTITTGSKNFCKEHYIGFLNTEFIARCYGESLSESDAGYLAALKAQLKNGGTHERM
jgi:predicted dehydrogenase